MANQSESIVSATDELAASLDVLERSLLADFPPEIVNAVADRFEIDAAGEAVTSRFNSAL